MKNLKKITRQNQKEIFGGSSITGCRGTADCPTGLCCRIDDGVCFIPRPGFHCAYISPVEG